MQDFLRTSFESEKLASHVKILKLRYYWAADVVKWLGMRKSEAGDPRAWMAVSWELEQVGTGGGPKGIALLVRTFPNLELIEFDSVRVYCR